MGNRGAATEVCRSGADRFVSSVWVSGHSKRRYGECDIGLACRKRLTLKHILCTIKSTIRTRCKDVWHKQHRITTINRGRPTHGTEHNDNTSRNENTFAAIKSPKSGTPASADVYDIPSNSYAPNAIRNGDTHTATAHCVALIARLWDYNTFGPDSFQLAIHGKGSLGEKVHFKPSGCSVHHSLLIGKLDHYFIYLE